MRIRHSIVKGFVAAGAVLALLIAAGCIPSLHPLYTDADIVFEPALVGTWDGGDAEPSLVFTQAGEDAYTLVYTEDSEESGAFDVHLASINGRLFLDLFPQEPDIDASAFYMLHLMPVHTFALVELSEQELKLSVIDPNWLDELLKQDPSAIKHEMVMDYPVFTASTEELQAFVTKYAETEGAFSTPMPLKRVVEAGPGEAPPED